ncbi:hypothetical protein RB200_41350 [Streptomyces sp. PmtG]
MRRGLLVGAVVAAVVVGAGVTAPAGADQAPERVSAAAPRLAEPGGGHRIGLSTLHLKDEGRADPWVPGERRELMVSLWYPAAKPSGTRAAYMTAAESRTYLEAYGESRAQRDPGGKDARGRQEGAAEAAALSPEVLSTVVTHSTVDAAPWTPPRTGGVPSAPWSSSPPASACRAPR